MMPARAGRVATTSPVRLRVVKRASPTGTPQIGPGGLVDVDLEQSPRAALDTQVARAGSGRQRVEA